MSMVGEEEPTYKILTVLILDYVATYIAFILGVLILIVVFSGILFGGSVLGTGIDQSHETTFHRRNLLYP